MSSQIEAERKDYYRELEAAQRGNVRYHALAELVPARASTVPLMVPIKPLPPCYVQGQALAAHQSPARSTSGSGWSSIACWMNSKDSSQLRSTPSSPSARPIRPSRHSGAVERGIAGAESRRRPKHELSAGRVVMHHAPLAARSHRLLRLMLERGHHVVGAGIRP